MTSAGKRKRGRPPLLSEDARSASFTIKLAGDELQLLRYAAEKLGLPVRQWAREELVTRALDLLEPEDEAG